MMHPEIDPRYLEEDIDLELLVQHLKFIRSLNEIEPWKSAIVREVQPGPACETDEHIYGTNGVTPDLFLAQAHSVYLPPQNM